MKIYSKKTESKNLKEGGVNADGNTFRLMLKQVLGLKQSRSLADWGLTTLKFLLTLSGGKLSAHVGTPQFGAMYARTFQCIKKVWGAGNTATIKGDPVSIDLYHLDKYEIVLDEDSVEMIFGEDYENSVRIYMRMPVTVETEDFNEMVQIFGDLWNQAGRQSKF